ncbi:MAG: PstS family phosphate ABC transporter substrate-binding protein [Cyanobacteria bacterium P01_G01_bin.54]
MKLNSGPLVTVTTVVAILIGVIAPACNRDRTQQDRPAERIQVDGSSTVAALTAAVGTAFDEYRSATHQDPAPVTVGISGTGGGFNKFCVADGIDIANASRAIQDSEQAQCAAASVEFIEIKVALDALTVAVNTESQLTELNFAQLQSLWRENSPISTWQDLDASLPAEPIAFFRPGDDSGTFDYFTEAILAYGNQDYTVRQTNSTNRVTPSEDDNTLVEGIEENPHAIGFFGFAYYKNNSSRVQSLKLAQAEGETAYAPSEDNVNTDKYPLARPLFIYVNTAAYASRAEVRDFVAFYMALLMIDAEGTPSGVRPEIIDFIASDPQSKGSELARTGNFLSTVGYISKPETEYALELQCIKEQFAALTSAVNLSDACREDLSAAANAQF